MRIFPVITTVLMLATPASAAPEAVAWARWAAHNAESWLVVDHAPWRRFLGTYLVAGADGINRVRYQAVTKGDKATLGTYVDRLGRIPVSRLSRAQQLAFWINLYNALTVKVVLDHYPVAGIRDIDISPGLFSSGPWGRKLVRVEGEEISLDDIEHRILRPLWKDPRVHYAVNCASLGCPNLTKEPFTAKNVDAMLDAAAHAYVNHPRGVHVDEDGDVVVSSIYDWFADDFGGSDANVIAHLRRYAEEPLLQKLEGATAISGDAYDWSLNSMD